MRINLPGDRKIELIKIIKSIILSELTVDTLFRY